MSAAAMEALRRDHGLRARIARELGISRQCVYRWRKIPAERVIEIERITEIPREILRPDLYRRAAE